MIGGLSTMLVLTSSPGQAPATAPPAREVLVFACGFSDGRLVSVRQAGDQFTYAFGRAGRPEIALTVRTGTASIFKLEGSAPRAGWTQLRFVNDATSYVPFHYFYLGNFRRGYSGATEQNGLFVYQHGRRVAKRLCTTGDGFKPDADLRTVPDDAEVDIVENF